MTLALATGHVWLRPKSEPAEGKRERREPAEAVSVEIAEDEDPFPSVAGGLDTGGEPVRVGEEPRIMERVPRIAEERTKLGGVEKPAPDEHLDDPTGQTRSACFRGERLGDRDRVGESP